MVIENLRRRAGRSIALLLGILVATAGFTVLTGSTETARLQVTGTVAEHARGSYDILVRPAGARSRAEGEHGLVQPNFLGGQYGGITAEQWQDVLSLPGVEVAAPVAMLGYAGTDAGTATFDITGAIDWEAERQLIEVRPRWLADRGLTTTPASDDVVGYVYVTRGRVVWPVFDQDEPYLEQVDAAEVRYTDGVVRDVAACGSPEELETRRGAVPYEISETGEAVPICVGVTVGDDPMNGRPDSLSVPVVELTGDGRLRGPGPLELTPDGRPRNQVEPVLLDRLTVEVVVPRPLLLVAAIDPAQEAALVGLDRAVVVGRYLAEDEPAVPSPWAEFYQVPEIRGAPALVSAEPAVDEQVVVEARQVVWDGSLYPGQRAEQVTATLARLRRGTVVASAPVDVVDGYREFVSEAITMLESGASGPHLNEDGSGFMMLDTGIQSLAGLGSRVRVGPVQVTVEPEGTLVPRTQPPVAESYPTGDPLEGLVGPVEHRPPPMSALAHDAALRPVEFTDPDPPDLGDLLHTAPVGVFDPALLSGLEGLGRVPLETYAVPHAVGADPATRDLLGDQPLLPPATTPGAYLTTPPAMLVSLDTILAYTNDPAPISAVRVRVAGVTGFDEVSRERVRVVAEQIATATGLDVDIVFGSSPAPQEVVLPAGEFGRPELRLAEDWSLKNVATTIVVAVDRKSVVLFGLILVVCVLFLANATAAAVRDRRRELAVLACLGWTRWRLGLTIAAEVTLLGLVAGALAAAVAPPLGSLTGVSVPVDRAWVAVPVAVLLALVASAVPAWRASRSHPAAALTPAVVALRARARRRRGVSGLAIANLLRAPGRTALGVVALAVGVGGLTLLVAVTVAFHGTVTGSLLGDAVSLRVRGADLAAVVAALTLGTVAVADVLYMNVRERAAELAALRAAGWSELALGRLVAYEGLGIGLVGSVLGVGAGVAGAWWFAGSLPAGLVGTAVAVAGAGTVLAGLAALVPAALLGRAPMAEVLAQE